MSKQSTMMIDISRSKLCMTDRFLTPKVKISADVSYDSRHASQHASVDRCSDRKENIEKDGTKYGPKVVVCLQEKGKKSMGGKYLVNGKIVEVTDFTSRVKKHVHARKHRNMLLVDITGQGSTREYRFNGKTEVNKYTVEMETGDNQNRTELQSDELRFENLFEKTKNIWINMNQLCEICHYNKVQIQRTIFELLGKAQLTKNSKLYTFFNIFRDRGPIKESARLTLPYLLACLYSKEESTSFDTLRSMIEGFVSGREETVLPESLLTYIQKFQLKLSLKTEIAIEMLKFQPVIECFVLRKNPKNQQKSENRLEEKLNFILIPKQKEFQQMTRNFREKNQSVERSRVNLFLKKDGDLLQMLQACERRTRRKIAVSPETRNQHAYSTSLLSKISETISAKQLTQSRPVSLVTGRFD